MKLSLVQMDISKGKPDENKSRVVNLIERASREDPDVLLLPEMWNTGYSLDNVQEIADNEGRFTAELIGPLARKYNMNIVAGSVSNITGRDVYNSMYIFDRKGKMTARYDKIHLFRLMEEHLYLKPGNSLCTFDLDHNLCGGIICYDLRFPELSRLLALRGVKLLLVPAEWPHPRLDHWRTLLKARAIENQFFVAACNRVGTDGDTAFFGNSMVIDPWGKIVGELSDEKEGILTVDIDIELVDRTRISVPVFEDRKPGIYRCSSGTEFAVESMEGFHEGNEMEIS